MKVKSNDVVTFFHGLYGIRTNNSLYVNIAATYSSGLPVRMVQQGTYHYIQHLYGQTCKNDKISYQWLNVEQKNACLL